MLPNGPRMIKLNKFHPKGVCMKYKRAFTVILKILVKYSDSQCATFYL